MPRRSIAALLTLMFAPAVAASAQTALKYEPFPSGYGYMNPAEITALNAAVKSGEHKTVRRHGWSLWAGIMQPSADPTWPIWYTWPNTKAAFLPPHLLGSTDMAAIAKAGPGKSLNQLSSTVNVGATRPGTNPVNVKVVPCYLVPKPVIDAYKSAVEKIAPTSSCPKENYNIDDGAHFLFNGDIMIPTESLSQEGFDWIRAKKLYEQATLNQLHADKVKDVPAPQRYVVTKHMYWPVKATGISAIPVWHDYHGGSYPGYAGYETWPQMVGVDPSGKMVGKKAKVSYLYNIYQYGERKLWPTRTATVPVHGLNEFYYHQVTKADWASFDTADKAILDAASYWAYNKPFEPGDYLVTIAMHINTREIPTWALQSAWWSDRPNQGRYAQDRPKLPQAKGPWRHYLLVDAYGIPDKRHPNMLPVATNPYIELVIHPVGTDCNNCHIRAGWPQGNNAGQASYQNPNCPDTLAALKPDSACFKDLTRTDFQWIIPDRAIK